MRGARLENWEKQLNAALQQVDYYLEDQYEDMFSLRPNRLERGKAANNKYDGLFAISAKFTQGYGSKYGPGYGIDLRIATLTTVNEEIKEQILKSAVSQLRLELKSFFPNRQLSIKLDGNSYKIIGDLSL